MNNWVWIALGIGALALFAFGRGGCGMGHGGRDHRRRGEESQDRARETASSGLSTPAKAESGSPSAQTAGHAQGPLEHAGHGNPSEQAEPRRHRHGC
jgi:hypothetical protein